MKFSEKWLREWVNPPISVHDLVEQLTMSGLEVESLFPVAGPFDQVVIGEVVSAEQHPDADRLRVCKVNVGKSELLNIVCGAANVRAGLKVPVALIGATIKEGFQIKAAKLRGVASEGMICSTAELGLTESSQGIMELPDSAPIGKNFREWLDLDDMAIDIHVTPNRGDCLSIAGIAREVAVLNHITLPEYKTSEVEVSIKDEFPVTVKNSKNCPRYVGRVVRGINPHAITPTWLSERLRRSGVRSIHPVVDIANYVMLELGQPLHAFDLGKIMQKIEVRLSKAGEKVDLLNEQTVELDNDTLVIADAKNILAMAGIMGGRNSAVSASTTDIFIESAFFSPTAIAGRARRYGLNTDASYRYERGVDPDLANRAMERVTQLVLEIAGGKAGPVIEVVDQSELPKPVKISLRSARINKVLGVSIPKEIIEKVLLNLGLKYEASAEGWNVIAPTYRFDLNIEEDLIEEIARVYGYNKIPAQMPQAKSYFLPVSETELSLAQIRKYFIDRGYREAITYSFVEPKLQQLLDPAREPIELQNPISAELSVMRTSLWPGLISTVQYNQNRQQNRLKFFETGLRFVQNEKNIQQIPMIAGVITDAALPEVWGNQKRAVDFYDLKGDLEVLFSLSHKPELFSFKKSEHPALHQGQTAMIIYDNKAVGYIGALHPALIEELKLVGPVYLFEMELEPLTKTLIPQYRNISKFPAIRRDLSFWLSQEILIQDVLSKIRQTVGDLLVDLFVFDVYHDKMSTENLRSIALGIVLQHYERTLVEAEITAMVEKVVKMLQADFKIQIRE